MTAAGFFRDDLGLAKVCLHCRYHIVLVATVDLFLYDRRCLYLHSCPSG